MYALPLGPQPFKLFADRRDGRADIAPRQLPPNLEQLYATVRQELDEHLSLAAEGVRVRRRMIVGKNLKPEARMPQRTQGLQVNRTLGFRQRASHF